jgi:hypothetical protein
MQRYCPLNSSTALNGELPAKKQRHAGNSLFIVKVNRALVVKLARSSFGRLLSKYGARLPLPLRHLLPAESVWSNSSPQSSFVSFARHYLPKRRIAVSRGAAIDDKL